MQEAEELLVLNFISDIFVLFQFRESKPEAARSSRVTGAPAKKPVQSKTMGRIKFASDDEEEKAPEETTKAESEEEAAKPAETVVFNQVNGDANDNGDDGKSSRRASRRCTYKTSSRLEVSKFHTYLVSILYSNLFFYLSS